MKKNPGTFLAVLVMTSGWLVMASNNPRVVFYQDFERGHDPVQLWRTSSSQYRVDFKGLTREKSFSGKGSFKLQVTVKEGSYTYWWLPVKIFPGASLRYSAKLLVAEPTNGRVRLVPGYGIIPDFPAWDGLNNLAPAFGPTGGQWKLVEGDILAMGRELLRSKLPVLAWGVTEENMGWYLNGLCLYLEMPEKGDGRFVLYLDEIKIEGESVPVEKYLAEVEKKWEPARARIKEQINAWEKRLSDLEKVLAGLGDLKGDEAVQDIREKLPHVRRRIITAESCGFIPPAQVGEMEGYFREIQQVIARTKKARGL